MLLTNQSFLTMQKNKKPEATNFGSNGFSLYETECDILPIIAESENLYKTDFAMRERYIKFIPGEKSDWLRKKYPNAFLLLSLIAERARRYNGHIDGFKIGWALIGDHKSAGLSRQNYRTALDILQSYKIIEILCRGKKDEKSTIQPTIKKSINGTLVNLIDSCMMVVVLI